ncbi:MAG: hypothetical protein U9O56_04540 [Campylobacterota bacterium]|nr:hypothetical protein [Campylobacterota bacterium]
MKFLDVKTDFAFKNAGRLEYVPSNLNEEIQTALEVVNEANLSKDELEAQHKRKEFISIQKLSILKAKEDGLQQGIEEGIEKGIEKGIMQGIEQEKLTIAKKSLLQGIDKETISLITNIPVSMIEKLKLQLTQ